MAKKNRYPHLIGALCALYHSSGFICCLQELPAGSFFAAMDIHAALTYADPRRSRAYSHAARGSAPVSIHALHFEINLNY